MDGLIAALQALAWQLGAGAALTGLALLVAWWNLGRLTARTRAGRITGRAAFHRFRLVRASCVLIALLPLVVLPLSVNTPLVASQLPLPLQFAVFSVGLLGTAALLALLLARLLVPPAWARLIGTPFDTRLYVAAIARTLLLAYVPLLLFIFALCLTYLVGLPELRWVLPLAAAGWVLATSLNSSRLRAWITGAVPIAQTPYADQEERITAWARLAGVPLRAILVDAIADGNADNALVAGPRQPTMFLGAELLAHTDWRQRDAVVGHELGHARLGHLYTNLLVAVLRILVFSSLVVGLIPLFQTPFAGASAGDASGGDLAALLTGVAGPVLFIFGLIIISFLGRLDRRRRHRMELDCDRFSAVLNGDPLAMIVLLHTITVLAGLPLRQRSQTHPTFNDRIAAMLQLLYQAGPRARWAFSPVPADIPFGTPQTSYTVPMDQAPAPAEVQRAPWQPAPLPAPLPYVLPPAPAVVAPPVYPQRLAGAFAGAAPYPAPAPYQPYAYPFPYAYPYAVPSAYPAQAPVPLPWPLPPPPVTPASVPPPAPAQPEAPPDALPDARPTDRGGDADA